MSFLGGGSNPLAGGASAGASNNERIEAAAAEIEMVADIYNKIVRSCHAKCISPRLTEATLTKGEGTCVDRCVNKYFAVNEIVGKRLNAQAAGQQPEPAKSGGGGLFGF